MSDPRIAEHLPLLGSAKWDSDTVSSFVAAKEAYWHRDGLGHWAICANGRYAGWGGFQKEGEEWDFGLVLKPEFFGLGLRIMKMAIAFARTDARVPSMTFLLPPSRKHLRALDRLGARFVGETAYNGEPFRKYQLDIR